MYVICQTLNGRLANPVPFDRRMTVNHLKRAVASSFVTEFNKVLLFFNNEYLDGDYNLTRRYNIQDGDVIEVMIMHRALTMNRQRWVGEVPGVDVGSTFSRNQLFERGLHRVKQCGIYANPGNRAYSIILSVEHDDMDFGDVIIYCGQRDPDPNKITMTNNTRALARCCNVQLCENGSSTFSNAWWGGDPVRVYKHIPDTTTYRYAGVYKVVGYWLHSVRGHNTWKFRLIRDPRHVGTLYEPYN